MKTLKNLVKLSSKVSVYVPATIDINRAIDNGAQVDAVAAALASWFGGSTYTPAVGCWISDAAGLVREKTTVVYSYATEAALQAHVDDLLDLCERLKADMSQEAISLEINGEMYFI